MKMNETMSENRRHEAVEVLRSIALAHAHGYTSGSLKALENQFHNP